MTDLVHALPVVLRPNATRTVVRPFAVEDPRGFAVPDHPRSERVVRRILSLDLSDVSAELSWITGSLEARHRDVEGLFERRFEELRPFIPNADAVARPTALLIGAYFSEEFSFESAALFNPSIVRHPDQPKSGAGGENEPEGDLRFVLSLRGIGEGHVSSLIFRTGTWMGNGEVHVEDARPFAVGPSLERSEGVRGEMIVHLECSGAQEISETVIFPFMPSQGRGIEDVRLVEFTEEDGSVDFRGTYTAFNGTDVRQGLLRTPDFKTFEMRGVEGPLREAKGMALFPRKIDGRYAMLGRQDNENIWYLTSQDPNVWEGGEKILEPQRQWEFIQMGNCGSPIELAEGWLVLTHGVGVARNYCVGAALLDTADPRKVLARLSEPLLQPTGEWKDGYVPNVVYSCGALLRGRTLLLPYGVADNLTTFATLDVDALLAAMTRS